MSTEALATEGIDTRVNNVMDILSKDPLLQDEQDTSTQASDPASAGNTEPPKKDAIGEDQDKTNKATGDKPQDATPEAIEPPVSWPSDDKEAFKQLPTFLQERVVARENEREAHFSERSRNVAARETELNQIQTRTQQAQQHFATEVQRLNQLATQLMPAKFSDITSEADYLRLKVENPARASEYEAFSQVLRNAQAQQQQVMQAQQQQHLDKEWNQLQTKFPEFKDAEKGPALLNEVRKAAVDYYGFTADEVQIIADHRHVPIIRDALAWRNHQANLKAAEAKKVPNSPNKPVLTSNAAGAGANLNADAKNKVLNRASTESDLRKKADMIAQLL